jgi:periplasmic copper chaperone A
MRPILRHFALSALLIIPFITACQPAKKPGVSDLVVKLPAATGRPGAAYFQITGNAQDSQLLSLSSPDVNRIELHDVVMKGSAMSMVKLEGGVAVPAGGTIKFAPGGKHAMLFDINPRVRPGSKMAISFSFADGQKIESEASVISPGDAVADHHAPGDAVADHH